MQAKHRLASFSLTLFAAAAFGGLSQINIPFPGGFGQAAAFSNTNGSLAAGSDLQTMLGSPKSFQEAAFAPSATTSVVANYSVGQIANSMSGTFGYGYLSATGSNAFPDDAFFSAAAVNGGWKETFTVTHPALSGQSGYLVFRVRGKGSITANGLTGSGNLVTSPYKNDQAIPQNQYFDIGGSDVIGSTDQYARWGHASFGAATSRNFDGVATMSVPLTFGTQFTLGVYAIVIAGQRSSGGNGGNSIGTIHAEFTWGGLVGVFNDAGQVSGATVISGSGKDWGLSAAPCPADFNGDGLVDDSDFTAFVAGYNILDCADPAMQAGCPADVNGDGFVDDADFVLFVVAYNALLCG
ncbi:MAG: hypothetical protein ACREJD_04695 [Phycisphaerales bacterium]